MVSGLEILRKACTSDEYRRQLKKQFVIRRLLEIGIEEYEGREIMRNGDIAETAVY